MVRPIIALLMLAVFSAFPLHAEERAIDIFLAHAQPQDGGADPAAATASEFRRQLSALSGGTLKVGIFPDGMLGGNRDMTKLVANGVIQSALVSTGGISTLYPLISVTAMPFALESTKAAYALYDGPFGRRLLADMEAKTGLVVLGFGDAGGMHVITNSRRPVRSPRDLAGLKLRTIPGYESLDAMIWGLGAIPVKVSSRDEFQSMEARIVDGQMNPPSVVLARHYYQVQGYATQTNHLYAPYVWVFNRAAFEGLTPAQQTAVREAARLGIMAGRKLSMRLDRSEQGAAGLSKRMEVYSPTPAEREAFKSASQPKVEAALAKTLGQDGVSFLAEFMKAAHLANVEGAR